MSFELLKDQCVRVIGRIWYMLCLFNLIKIKMVSLYIRNTSEPINMNSSNLRTFDLKLCVDRLLYRVQLTLK